jgi:hypothetical protein
MVHFFLCDLFNARCLFEIATAYKNEVQIKATMQSEKLQVYLCVSLASICMQFSHHSVSYRASTTPSQLMSSVERAFTQIDVRSNVIYY